MYRSAAVLWAAVLAIAVGVVLPSVAAAEPGGELSAFDGRGGCYSGAADTFGPQLTYSRCVFGVSVGDSKDAFVLSRDGRFAYAVTAQRDAVLEFRRDPVSGGLLPLAGRSHCITEVGSVDASRCRRARGLRGVQVLALSRDGRQLYIGADVTPSGTESPPERSSHVLSILQRNPRTGALWQRPGPGACLAWGGSDGAGQSCKSVVGTVGVVQIVVARDGRNAYVLAHPFRPDPSSNALDAGAAAQGDRVTLFRRSRLDGALTPVLSSGGCLTARGGLPCVADASVTDIRRLALDRSAHLAYATIDGNRSGLQLYSIRRSGLLAKVRGSKGCVGIELRGPRSSPAVTRCGRKTVGLSDLQLSPVGSAIYVTGSDLLAAQLIRHAGRWTLGGCVENQPDLPGVATSPRCSEVPIAYGAAPSAALSPDGGVLCLGGQLGDAPPFLDGKGPLQMYRTHPGGGALTFDGCLGDGAAITDGLDPCQTVPDLDAHAVVPAPDGTGVYAVGGSVRSLANGLRIDAGTVTLHGDRATIAVSCAALTACHGSIRFTAADLVLPDPQRLGQLSVSLGRGQREQLVLHLTRDHAGRVAHFGALDVIAEAHMRLPAGRGDLVTERTLTFMTPPATRRPYRLGEPFDCRTLIPVISAARSRQATVFALVIPHTGDYAYYACLFSRHRLIPLDDPTNDNVALTFRPPAALGGPFAAYAINASGGGGVDGVNNDDVAVTDLRSARTRTTCASSPAFRGVCQGTPIKLIAAPDGTAVWTIAGDDQNGKRLYQIMAWPHGARAAGLVAEGPRIKPRSVSIRAGRVSWTLSDGTTHSAPLPHGDCPHDRFSYTGVDQPGCIPSRSSN